MITFLLLVKRAFYEGTVLSCLIILTLAVVSADTMTSGSYKIISDSLNIGGGYSTSSNYVMESTVGEVATGLSTSSNYALRAGYQQMQEIYLSMSAISDVVMSPNLGLAGGTSSGTASFVVMTDSPSGYLVTLSASDDPALKSNSASIPNYVPTGLVPDANFITGVNEVYFGFTPEGPDIVSRYKDNGSGTCGVGGLDTVATCWDTVSTTSRTVVIGTGSNHPTGATTTLRFRVTAGATAAPVAGTYVATTTVTALPQ